MSIFGVYLHSNPAQDESRVIINTDIIIHQLNMMSDSPNGSLNFMVSEARDEMSRVQDPQA